MPQTGRPKTELVLSDEERQVLERLTRRRKSAQALALRARIVLACAAGATNQAVAADLRVNGATVGKWRRRFVERRLEGLFDEPRPGATRTVTDDKVEAVIIKTLEEKPADATHWSTRSMAQAMGMSQTSISLIWRAFGLQPHRAESFKLSTDPQFVDKVKDIVGLYLDPPERAVVLCVDEKSQIQALARFQPILPMMPGTPNDAATTTSATAPRPCSRRSTWRTARSSAHCTVVTGRQSSRSSWCVSMKRFPRTSRYISSSTTTPPTRPPTSNAGCCVTVGSISTSRRRRDRG